MNNNWLTFQGNPARTGEAKEVLIPPLKKVWEFKLNNQIAISSPIVNNNFVYIGTTNTDSSWSGTFYALDSNTGNLLWKFEPGCPLFSAPTVGNGKVYVLAENNVLYALDAISGKKLWEFKHGRSAWPRTYPLLAGNVVCITTDKLYLIDANSGRSVFEKKSDRENSGTSPALYEGVLYLGCGTSIVAFDLSSRKTIWEKSFGSKTTFGPVIKDDVIYIGIMMGYLIALDVNKGNQLWAIRMPNDPEGHSDSFPRSYPAISQNKLYIGAQNGVFYSLDTQSGKGIWGFEMGISLATSPIVSGNIVYILSGKGNFYALDVSNGAKVWEFSSPIHKYDIQVSAAICDGKLFAAWDKVYAFSK